MLQLSEEQLNTLNKEALIIIVASLQDQLSSMREQLDTANAQLSDTNRQIELLTEQIRIMNQRKFGKQFLISTSFRRPLSSTSTTYTCMLLRPTMGLS